MCKGFDQRDMLLKHIPYISRTSNLHIPFNQVLSHQITMNCIIAVISCLLLLKFHPLWDEANYGSLRWKLWQFLVKSASNADSGNVKRQERLP